MCDPEGDYFYKNGNEYRGQFKTCSKFYTQQKYGIIEGSGVLKVAGLGTYKGNFINNMIHGDGTFEFTNSKKKIEGTWKNCKIDDFVKEMKD